MPRAFHATSRGWRWQRKFGDHMTQQMLALILYVLQSWGRGHRSYDAVWQTAASDNIPAIALLSLGFMTTLNQSTGLHASIYTQIFTVVNIQATWHWSYVGTSHEGQHNPCHCKGNIDKLHIWQTWFSLQENVDIEDYKSFFRPTHLQQWKESSSKKR